MRISKPDLPPELQRNLQGWIIHLLTEKAGRKVWLPMGELMKLIDGTDNLGIFMSPNGVMLKILDHEPTSEDVTREELGFGT